MKSRLLVLMFLAGGTMFAGPRIFVRVGGGVRFGYVAPPVVAYVAPPVPVYAPVGAYAPPSPGPGYAWVAGYNYPVGAGFGWHAGYWARPPYAHAYWVAPRYYGGRYTAGFWRR